MGHERRNVRQGTVAAWAPIRWPIEMTASVEEAGSCALDITVVDLSVTGCRIYAGFRLTTGRAARLRVPGLAPLPARISWSRDWHAGLAFDQLLHPSVVQHLVQQFRPALARTEQA